MGNIYIVILFACLVFFSSSNINFNDVIKLLLSSFITNIFIHFCYYVSNYIFILIVWDWLLLLPFTFGRSRRKKAISRRRVWDGQITSNYDMRSINWIVWKNERT